MKKSRTSPSPQKTATPSSAFCSRSLLGLLAMIVLGLTMIIGPNYIAQTGADISAPSLFPVAQAQSSSRICQLKNGNYTTNRNICETDIKCNSEDRATYTDVCLPELTSNLSGELYQPGYTALSCDDQSIEEVPQICCSNYTGYDDEITPTEYGRWNKGKEQQHCATGVYEFWNQSEHTRLFQGTLNAYFCKNNDVPLEVYQRDTNGNKLSIQVPVYKTTIDAEGDVVFETDPDGKKIQDINSDGTPKTKTVHPTTSVLRYEPVPVEDSTGNCTSTESDTKAPKNVKSLKKFDLSNNAASQDSGGLKINIQTFTGDVADVVADTSRTLEIPVVCLTGSEENTCDKTQKIVCNMNSNKEIMLPCKVEDVSVGAACMIETGIPHYKIPDSETIRFYESSSSCRYQKRKCSNGDLNGDDKYVHPTSTCSDGETEVPISSS